MAPLHCQHDHSRVPPEPLPLKRLLNKRGIEVTARSDRCVRYLDEFTDQVLAYGGGAGNLIRKAIGEDPSCLYAHTCLAASSMFADKAQGFKTVELHLQEARNLLQTGTEREILFFTAVEAWRKGDMNTALDIHQTIADKYPRDVYSVKLCQVHYLMMGKKQELLDVVEKVVEANSDDHFVHGMHGFGLVECGRYEEAEAAGRLAVKMAPNGNDPWAHHCVAHVMEETGRHMEGIAWMESHAHHWLMCNSFMFTHNWWHTAIFYLDINDVQKAWDIYEHKIWSLAKKKYRDQVNATSLLWRLELRREHVGRDHWRTLARYVKPRVDLSQAPFTDAHYVYALARNGDLDVVNRIISRLAALPDDFGYYGRPKEVIIPLLKFLAFFAIGEHEKALRAVKPAVDCLLELGGSNAQQDVFLQTYIVTLKEAGLFRSAEELLHQTFLRRNSSTFFKQQRCELAQSPSRDAQHCEDGDQYDELPCCRVEPPSLPC